MYIFRADGNATIGIGHLMRRFTIADALKEQLESKDEILFVCADEPSAKLVKELGFHAEVLATVYSEMQTELPIWAKLLCKNSEPNTTILVDSYYVTENYLEELKQYGRVVLLDDLQEKTYPADVVINYNLYAEESVYKKLYHAKQPEFLIGSKYVPVRRQFLNMNFHVAPTVKHVLITTGGGDRDNIAGAILQQIYCENIEFHVVTGRFNPHLQELREWEKKSGVHVYYDVKDMAVLMAKCDVAVTAGGTTVYELAAMGVPFICFSYAENRGEIDRVYRYKAGCRICWRFS